ncbi:hypothetical protein POTOM_008877 [Populus tomentosa]|uniref:Ubiquitin-like domain-containing protein n=1 Tax=Populus tomentosa TaxID=118781 RepID=A0A8X8AI65_POPTO|nr:hypothetical protein POTOM_008877 [Populus tomentosa]
MSGATGQPQEEDKKPNDQSAHINLKVKGQDGNEVFFRIKRSTQLKKLMNAYCDRQSVEFNSIAFLFDGRRLRGEQTPDEGHGIGGCEHIYSGLVLLYQLSPRALTVTVLSYWDWICNVWFVGIWLLTLLVLHVFLFSPS